MKYNEQPKTNQPGNVHLRQMRSVPYSESPLPERFQEFSDWALLPQLELNGYRRTLAEKKRIATHCIHRLIGAGLVGRCIADTRDCRKPGVRMRVEVWKSIDAAGLAETCVGSEYSGKATRYVATESLLTMQKVWKLFLTTNLALSRNTQNQKPTKQALVSIHSGKFDLTTGFVLPTKQQRKLVSIESTGPQNELIRFTEDILEAFNRNNLAHSWKAVSEGGHAFQPNPCLRQVHSGGWLRLARYYTFGDVGGQQLRKSIRCKMRIDGKRTAELDLEGSLLRMVYHKYGIDPDSTKDIYQPTLIFPKLHAAKNLSPREKATVRAFVKKATIICLNAKKRSTAHSAVGQSMANSKDREFLANAIYNVEKTSPKGIVMRLVKIHKPIAGDFFNEIGPWMMTREAEVMEWVMFHFIVAHKPALLIHDAIVVKRDDADFAKKAITLSYRGLMGFDPVVKTAY